MHRFFHLAAFRRVLPVAALLAVCFALLLPATASAHAILLRSIPAQDAVLTTPPTTVQMWFSEDLNPAFSTAVVINAQNQRVDQHDAHVSPNDTKEMDVSLQSNLPPNVYVVVWRSQSNDDGHILRGSFLFTVAEPDGTVPRLSGTTVPGQGVLGGGNLAGLYTGQLDGPTFFNLIMITLVELGAVFWVGAQFWQLFVLQPATEDAADRSAIHNRVQQRFDRYLSPITLLVLLLANIGVLIGQALTVTGALGSSLDAGLLTKLGTSGRFGIFWTMREIVIFLALVVAVYMLLSRQRPRLVNKLLPWLNLILGLALFIAITMSSHASAVSSNLVIFAIPVDWLHLVAAALWVGGMMYIATSFLPILRSLPIPERARSLVTVLPYFTPWAIAGIVIMAVTGPFSATFHLNSWQQLFTTAYGRALTIKIVLVGGLLLTSAIHVLLLRPRLKRETKKYAYAVQRLEAWQAVAAPKPVATKTAHIEDDTEGSSTTTETDAATRAMAHQVKLREERLSKGTHTMTRILRWEPVLGVAVLVCVGLMNVFAGTLSPIATAQQQQPTTSKPGPFNTTVRTTDNKFTVKLNVNPNTFGTNVFTVTVIDNSTGKPTTNVGVSLYDTMLDMDMGTNVVNLQPDGKGHFSSPGDLSMAGNWDIRIQIRTLDNTLHEANVKLFTPF